MKKIIALVTVVCMGTAWAEVGVKVDKVDTNQDTTISIQKGKTSTFKRYILAEGEQELVGDTDVVRKSAEQNWKKECTDWKKEFRADNKDNKIIAISCGRMTCAKEGVETTCTSTAKYKVKTLAEE